MNCKEGASKDENLQLDSGLGLSMEDPLIEHVEHLNISDNGFDLFAQDKDGDSALHIAISQKSVDLSLRIIALANKLGKGKDLNLKDNFGLTPLMLAVQLGLCEITRCLIDSKVDVECLDAVDLNNIVHVAAENKDTKILETIFTDSGYLSSEMFESLVSLINARNDKGLAPFHIAVNNKDLDFIKLLMQLQVDVNARDSTCGYTGLHHSVLSGDTAWVKAFISQCRESLNLDELSFNGNTAYQLAALNQQVEIMEVLLTAGATPDL
eukprot:gene12725-14030_t